MLRRPKRRQDPLSRIGVRLKVILPPTAPTILTGRSKALLQTILIFVPNQTSSVFVCTENVPITKSVVRSPTSQPVSSLIENGSEIREQ